MNWEIGDSLVAPYLGRGIVTEIAPQITIRVIRGASSTTVKGSQSSLSRLGWKPEAIATIQPFSGSAGQPRARNHQI